MPQAWLVRLVLRLRRPAAAARERNWRAAGEIPPPAWQTDLGLPGHIVVPPGSAERSAEGSGAA
eukprot:11177982-Lingulodinium_polyedra.AAC.1